MATLSSTHCHHTPICWWGVELRWLGSQLRCQAAVGKVFSGMVLLQGGGKEGHVFLNSVWKYHSGCSGVPNISVKELGFSAVVVITFHVFGTPLLGQLGAPVGRPWWDFFGLDWSFCLSQGWIVRISYSWSDAKCSQNPQRPLAFRNLPPLQSPPWGFPNAEQHQKCWLIFMSLSVGVKVHWNWEMCFYNMWT